MQEIHLEMIHLGSDGFYAVDEPIRWMLVNAIQELKAANDALRRDFECCRRAHR